MFQDFYNKPLYARMSQSTQYQREAKGKALEKKNAERID
jgi:hypothetical protein